MNWLLVSLSTTKISKLETHDYNLNLPEHDECQKLTWSTERTVHAALVANLIPQNLVM